jgi:hypothetical protein
MRSQDLIEEVDREMCPILYDAFVCLSAVEERRQEVQTGGLHLPSAPHYQPFMSRPAECLDRALNRTYISRDENEDTDVQRNQNMMAQVAVHQKLREMGLSSYTLESNAPQLRAQWAPRAARGLARAITRTKAEYGVWVQFKDVAAPLAGTESHYSLSQSDQENGGDMHMYNDESTTRPGLQSALRPSTDIDAKTEDVYQNPNQRIAQLERIVGHLLERLRTNEDEDGVLK